MSKFKVGQKIAPFHTGHIYTVLYVDDKGMLLDSNNSKVRLWVETMYYPHYAVYVQPKRNITRWLNFYMYEGLITLGNLHSTKQAADAGAIALPFKQIEITFEVDEDSPLK